MNESLFSQKINLLKQVAASDLPTIEAIADWVTNGQNDISKTKYVMPKLLARQYNLAAHKMISEFLRAVPLGLFDLVWSVRCPHCAGIVNAHEHLSQASGLSYCKMCAQEFSTDFSERVEVTFSLNREIDDREVNHTCSSFLSALGRYTSPEDRLSGLEVIHYPEFKILFGEEVLSQREQLQVASVTVLFTDITGSTQMYEKLGDAVAYNIVRDHFDILFSILEAHGGTVVKTIGDAVMASFISNRAALSGIINALDEFKRYNSRKHINEQVYIKIGIHRGPAILVTLNDRLDYFGSTINKAARIQSLANSGEICFSEQVYQDAEFLKQLRELSVEEITRHSVNLKGIEGIQTIYRLATHFGSTPTTA